MFKIKFNFIVVFMAGFSVFLLLIIFCWKALQYDPHALPSMLINQSVPKFSLPELYALDKNFTQKDLENKSNNKTYPKIILLNIFATWCISCHLEHPVWMDIAAAQKKQKNSLILIYGIAYKDSREKLIAWLKKAGNPYQKIGLDTQGAAAINLGVYGTPETFVIDDKGIIRARHIGPVTQDVWQHELKPEIQKITREELTGEKLNGY